MAVFVTLVRIASVAAWASIRSYHSHTDDDTTLSDQLAFFREMKQRRELSGAEFLKYQNDAWGTTSRRVKI